MNLVSQIGKRGVKTEGAAKLQGSASETGLRL